MQGIPALVLGLGLFFLGIQLVGQHLRRLAGPSFRRTIHRVSERPLLAGLAGVGFGALMQSATAVTFVLTGMVRGGIVTDRGAAPVILWCNVGLTALAFLVTLDIHSYVAYLVGGAGIFSATVRQPRWRAAAGVLLGVGLILFGLESMGDSAAPIKNEEWFQSMLAATVGSPVIAFAIGIAVAAILQSNTGAAMLVITLAGVGSFDLEQAAMLLYGTNLGAIPLRQFLSLNLDRPSRRLVRFEDLFCLWSGALLTALFLAEKAGIPLVLAGVGHIAETIPLQLALVFLLSNLLPAIVLSFFIGPVTNLLQRWMPGEVTAALAQPKYLTDSAIGDPGTAIDLMAKEISRLLIAVHVRPERAEIGDDGEPVGDPAFGQLSEEIEHYGARIASKNELDERDAHLLHLLRAELSLVRYFEDAVREFNDTLHELAADPATSPAARTLRHALHELIRSARNATQHPTTEAVEHLRAQTKRHGDFVKAQTDKAKSESSAPAVAALADAFELAAWMLHRLSKVLTQFVDDRRPVRASPAAED